MLYDKRRFVWFTNSSFWGIKCDHWVNYRLTKNTYEAFLKARLIREIDDINFNEAILFTDYNIRTTTSCDRIAVYARNCCKLYLSQRIGTFWKQSHLIRTLWTHWKKDVGDVHSEMWRNRFRWRELPSNCIDESVTEDWNSIGKENRQQQLIKWVSTSLEETAF